MLILSQNKEKIVNTKNIVGFDIDFYTLKPAFSFDSIPPTDTIYKIVVILENGNTQITIGRYDTPKRAKEILKQLYYMYSEELKANYETTFEMPEK